MIELPILGDKVQILYLYLTIEDTQTQEYFEEFNERYELRVYYYEEDNNFMIKILRIVSLGLFSLFEKWFVQVSLLSFQKSTDPSHLLIQKMKDGKRMSKDKIIKCKRDGDRIKFKYEYINFLITPQNQLKKLELINYDYNELSKYEAQQRQILYGENIMQIEECTRSQILFNEILSPFNIFQVFSFIVWTLDDYYLYAILIAILTIIQIAISLYDLEQQNHKIREMIYYENSVIVHRDHHQLKISSKDLVPGDIVEVTAKSMITFDGQLIQGEAVFNEAILTGESTPILKTINLEIFSGSVYLQVLIVELQLNQQVLILSKDHWPDIYYSIIHILIHFKRNHLNTYLFQAFWEQYFLQLIILFVLNLHQIILEASQKLQRFLQQ